MWFRAGSIGYMFLLTCGLAYSLFLDISGYAGVILVGFNLLKTAQGELTDLYVRKIPGAKGEKTLPHNTCGVVEYLVHT